MGWIPFDTVPGYEENIVYQLPEDGDPAENENGTTYTGQDQTPQQNQTDISQEPQDDHSQRIFIQSVLLALAALVLVCLAAMVLRTVLLRRRLKQQRRRFEDPDGRAACQAMLSALHRQLTALQPGAWSEASPQRQAALTALLGDETARQLTALEQEVWFSDHPIEEPQRQQAQKLLGGDGASVAGACPGGQTLETEIPHLSGDLNHKRTERSMKDEREDTSRKPPSVGSADVPDAAVAAAFGGAGGGHPADRPDGGDAERIPHRTGVCHLSLRRHGEGCAEKKQPHLQRASTADTLPLSMAPPTTSASITTRMDTSWISRQMA